MPRSTPNVPPAPPRSPVWPAALAFAAVFGSLAASCMMPFVALAAVAAATLPLHRAALAVALAWAANQLLGFTLLGFPPTAYAFAWGGALLAASLLATGVARAVVGGRGELVATRHLAAFAAAFVAYEAALFGFAHLAGGLETFTPSIVWQLAVNEALWFAGLVALRLTLTGAAPRWFGPPPALRFA